MRSFEFETWDDGRLIVNREFSSVLRENDLTSFAAVRDYSGGAVAKNLLRERTTTRIELPASDGRTAAFYVKKHTRPPLKEYVKPLLRLTRPILGARNEWDAMIGFHRLGIDTMVPVALGKSGGDSFVMSQAIDGCTKLSHWMEQHLPAGEQSATEHTRRLAEQVAGIARTMHAAGLHHQDFYLTHLLVPENDIHGRTFVIDLGRVCQRRRLSTRWIVKDLAQLNYSAAHFSADDRRHFMKAYFGRDLQRSDQPLLRRIERKTRAIARHSRRNSL